MCMQRAPGEGAPAVGGGRVAIVTGASSGIGRALALGLAARGFHTLVMARRVERLRELAAEVEAAHALRCVPVAVDLADLDAARAAFAEALGVARREGWTLVVLANNAGVGEWRPFLRVPLERQLQGIDLNVKAATLLTRLFLDEVVPGGQRAYVLNVASMAAFSPVPNYAVYAATKSYLRSFGESLAFELRGTAVSVTGLYPGGTATEFLEVAGNQTTPLARLGTMSAEAVAACGLKALFKGRRVAVPGASNRFVRRLVGLLPLRWGQRLLDLVLGLGMKRDWLPPTGR